MDPKLLNYINVDLKWNTVKRGHRSMTRRPRKLGSVSFDIADKRQEPDCSDLNKSGPDVLGRHLAEKAIDAPLKKRRLFRQSPSPPPPASCPGVEGGLSPGPQTPVVRHEDLGPRCSNSLSLSQKTKSKVGSRNHNISKLTKKDVCGSDDFSGIELLAAAACSSFISDDVDRVEEFLLLKEHTTTKVHLCTGDIKETIIPTESNGSSIQHTHDNGTEEGEKKVASSKESRLHWDLNTVMDEWEEPCNDLLVEPQVHENFSEGVYNGGSNSGKMNVEGHESRCVEAVGVEERSMLDSVYVIPLSVQHDADISAVSVDKNYNVDSFGKTYEELTCTQEVMGTKKITSKASDGESSATKSDVVDSLVHPEKCEDFSTSTTSVFRKQTTVKAESDTIEGLLVQSMPKNTTSESDRQPVLEETMQGDFQSPKLCNSYCDNKVNSEDPVSECCGSNVTQDEDEQGQLAEEDTIDKVQVGYDSPYEDGELREPIGWEENEAEDKETLCFGSVIEIPSSGKIEASCDNVETIDDQSLLPVKETVPDNDIEQGAQADTYNDVSGCQVKIDCGSGRGFSERKNGHGESRLRGGNLLHNDESTSFNACRNGAYVWQNRSGNFGDFYPRTGRDLGPEKSSGRDKVSFQDGCHNDTRASCVDSSIRIWDLKSSHNYYKPKRVNGDSAVRSGGCQILENNQSRNYSTKGVYRTHSRRPSPSERTNGYGIHRGPPVRSLSRDRYRVGSGIHPREMRRATEEEYNDSKPSYLERKTSYVPPNFNRPGRRSRSRSRSGSPIAWNFQKRRNSDGKQSPDREARFKGERGPFQKPSNSVETEAGFVSLSRCRVSPERTTKCFDDRKFVDSQFRDKRQVRNQRCEPIGYPERLKSDDHFRFTQRPVREHRCKDNKQDGPYEKVNRGGRSDDAGSVRRFRYTMDESFETRNRRNLGGYARDARNEHSCYKDAGIPESKI